MHFAIYVVVNLVLFFMWWLRGDASLWFVYVLVFWGIGLSIHAVGVFAGISLSDRLTEREFRKLTQGSDRMTVREFQTLEQEKQQ